ncbi:hypothetical protein PLICRDRAFT_455415 [Plicaturopsis crispa FD-325 SS-3]|uniref:Uncharacterized protein n=1 Tax=Plicaturopsis crispa FD-325 SS-3 TaxID=944288 RepID=A0A0C9SK73_PLICR|nr:hypothetical protein PLICRDRAFT_455415 [Plicaturopsis crispa FD-325 SS-3]
MDRDKESNANSDGQESAQPTAGEAAQTKPSLSKNLLFKVKRDQTGECDPWLKAYFAKITTRDGELVGRLTYRIVDVPMLRGQYEGVHASAELSERGGSELEDLLGAMYDPSGRPKASFFSLHDGPDDSADGYKPDEDLLSFVLISGDAFEASVLDDEEYEWEDGFYVKEKFLEQGAGPWALKKVVSHRTVEYSNYIIARPTQFIDTAMLEKAEFCRIGKGPWFVSALWEPGFR